MEVKMQTSFIPKRPVVESRPEGSGVSLFLLLSIIIFIVAIALAVAVWLFQKSLVTKIETAKQDLFAAKSSYEEDTINPLIRLDDRINESNKLLSNHIAISPIFTLLEENILRNVRLKTMKFSYAGTDKIKIDLSGNATSYDVLSKQSDTLGREDLRKLISQPVISDFNPTVDGSISFNFSAIIKPILISYEKTVLESPAAEVLNEDTPLTQ
jgi:hypothetical protein